MTSIHTYQVRGAVQRVGRAIMRSAGATEPRRIHVFQRRTSLSRHREKQAQTRRGQVYGHHGRHGNESGRRRGAIRFQACKEGRQGPSHIG